MYSWGLLCHRTARQEHATPAGLRSQACQRQPPGAAQLSSGSSRSRCRRWNRPQAGRSPCPPAQRCLGSAGARRPAARSPRRRQARARGARRAHPRQLGRHPWLQATPRVKHGVRCRQRFTLAGLTDGLAHGFHDGQQGVRGPSAVGHCLCGMLAAYEGASPHSHDLSSRKHGQCT